MKTSEVLNRAADLIEKRGWAKGRWPSTLDDDSEVCLEGGILAAIDETLNSVDLSAFWSCPAYRAVMDYLGRDGSLVMRRGWGICPKPAEPLWAWNDQFGRTAEEVVATLRAAAVIEAAKETPPYSTTLAAHAEARADSSPDAALALAGLAAARVVVEHDAAVDEGVGVW